MAEKINATCSICGKGYHLCMSCHDMMSLTPWKKHTDTAEHYKIYQILHGYSTGVYTKAEARAKFRNVDLSDFDSLRDGIKATITSIMGVNKEHITATNTTEYKSESAVKTATAARRKTADVAKPVEAEEVVTE